VTKSPDQESYLSGTPVQLTATAFPGWTFTGWSGDLSGSTNPATITMDGNKTVTATFIQDVYTLEVTVIGFGSISKVPEQESYLSGTLVQLTATADPGWTFTGWSGDLSGITNPATITMDGNKTITATFTQGQYSLTVTPVGSGSVSRDNEEPYYLNDVVQLTATADPGWTFTGWSGDLVSTDNPTSITINGNMNVTATFTQNTYTLTIDMTGEGTVDRSYAGPYHYGDDVQLTAIPAMGWHFVRWTGDLISTDNPVSFWMDGNKSVIAVFEQDVVNLIVNVTGSGSVTQDPLPQYLYGASVELTAIPAIGWHFVRWEGDLTGTENPKTIILNGNKIVIAIFEQNNFTLMVNITGSGSVSKNPDQTSYLDGASVELTAVPATGWHFVRWEGDLTGSVNPETITLNGNKAVTAVFEQLPIEVILSIIQANGGTISVEPAIGPYYVGDTVTFTASAATGYTFFHWTGFTNQTTNPLTMVLDGNKTVSAYFQKGLLRESFDTLTNWVTKGKASMTLDSQLFNEGTSSIRLTMPAREGYGYLIKTVNWDLSPTDERGNLRFWVYLSGTGTPSRLEIVLANDPAMKNSWIATIDVTQLSPGWNLVELSTVNWTLKGKASWISPIIRLQLNAYGSGGVFFSFDGLTTGRGSGDQSVGSSTIIAEMGVINPEQLVEIPAAENTLIP